MKRACSFIGVLAGVSLATAALAETFTVKDIRLEGLARVPASQIYGVLPLSAGDVVDDARIAESVRSVFRTGNFEDVRVLRDGDVLVYQLAERPFIIKIDLKGNKSIDKDSLLKGLKQAGLAEGKVLQRSTLDHVKQELERQYIAQGRYAASIDVNVVARPRNRVEVEIKIVEGDVASIRSINFVGNRVYTDDVLKDEMQLKERHFTSMFKNDDKYSREKFSADLETIRSWYLDRGFANFQVDSFQVNVTPDRKQVYLEVNLNEGEKYTVGEVKLIGELPVPEEQLRALLLIKKDQVFSQRLMTNSTQLINKRLGNDGYIYAEVNGVPELDHEKKVANVTVYVNPGKQVYVRRINFRGNMKTDDEVMRREMRQYESALASNDRIDLSKQRLQRLGFFKEVKLEKVRVPGTNDQVDLGISVEEQPSGSIGASIGYSQGSGMTFSANVSQDNFFGTGNKVAFGVNRSETRDSYNLSFVDPYFTDDGISRGFSFYYRKTKFDSLNVSNYVTDSQGGSVSFGYPIDETERISLSFGYDQTQITTGVLVADVVDDFIKENGDSTQTYTTSVAWSRSTLNRGMFADRGASQSLGIELTIPVGTVNYYKLSYSGQLYVPLTESWVARLRTDLGYGNGVFGDTTLPFYKNFFAGGFGSVRGFRENTLGPTSPSYPGDTDPNPVGGNVLVEASAELILPMPFMKDSSSVRSVLFLDTGNAYDTHLEGYDVSLEGLRMSAGVGLSWVTPIGPLTFALAKPIRKQDGDKTQTFQFTIGQGF